MNPAHGPITPQDRADIKRVLRLYGNPKNWAAVRNLDFVPPASENVFLPIAEAAKPARELLKRIEGKL